MSSHGCGTVKCEELHVLITKSNVRQFYGASCFCEITSLKYKPNTVTIGCYVTLKVKVIQNLVSQIIHYFE